MFNRRSVLRLAAGAAALGLVPAAVRAAAPAGGLGESGSLEAALAATDLIYLTPLKADGSESRCQSEIWFVADATDIYVVTAADAWRARAVKSGLHQARVWVGDLGTWTKTEGRYRTLPQIEATGESVTAPADHERVLELFGSKYSMSWLVWGPRFRNGLADGSRVMLRYRPVVA